MIEPVFKVSSVMPMMAFIGVRISWLIVASSRDLACDASDNFSFSVMSRLMDMRPMTLSLSSRHGIFVVRCQRMEPFFR